MNDIRGLVRRFCVAFNNISRTYCKISDKGTEIWLLYVLDDGEPHSQKQICEEWGFPRTTLNTIIKQAEAAGYLTLIPIPGKRRERNISLTENGKIYAKKILKPVYQAEEAAMREVLAQKHENFVAAIEQFETRLKEIVEEQRPTLH